jgi:hypothetical protein
MVMPDDYAVGYKKPPKHSQFKKGQTGNPNGRRGRGTQNTTLSDEMRLSLALGLLAGLTPAFFAREAGKLRRRALAKEKKTAGGKPS